MVKLVQQFPFLRKNKISIEILFKTKIPF